MFDAYTFFTEEEPESKFIHKGRHWFGKPSQRQNPVNLSQGNDIEQLLIDNQQFQPLFNKLAK